MIAGRGYKEQRAVKILFDESFFNSRDESHEVFCVDQPLEGGESIFFSHTLEHHTHSVLSQMYLAHSTQ